MAQPFLERIEFIRCSLLVANLFATEKHRHPKVSGVSLGSQKQPLELWLGNVQPWRINSPRAKSVE